MIKSNLSRLSGAAILFFSILTVNLALADNLDPFEKRLLVRTNPLKFEPGVCPGNPLSQIPKPAPLVLRSELTVAENFARDQKYQRALKAAEDIYNLPDFESVRTGGEFLDQFLNFQNSIPNGYKLYAYFGEPETGAKYAIFQPERQISQHARIGSPWILTIAGTKSFMDVISDLDMGRNQLQKMSRLKSIFTSCQFLDDNGSPLSEQHWIFTGHSLGGGLAQAFAYQVQEIRLSQKLKPLRLELLTFNGFGAQELVAKDGQYNPQITRYIEARNYFVFGEPISKIGHHIGPTYVLAEDGVDLQTTTFSVANQLRRHGAAAVWQAARGALLQSKLNDETNRISPPTSQFIGRLIGLGAVARIITPAIYEQSEERTVRLLDEASAALASRPVTPATAKVRIYLLKLIGARLRFLDRPSNGPMTKILVEKLVRARARL